MLFIPICMSHKYIYFKSLFAFYLSRTYRFQPFMPYNPKQLSILKEETSNPKHLSIGILNKPSVKPENKLWKLIKGNFLKLQS